MAGSTTTRLEQGTPTPHFVQQRGMCRQGRNGANKAPCPCHQKHGNDSESFHEVIQHLFDNHEQIQRRVKMSNATTEEETNSPTNAESMMAETWSQDPQVAKWIQKHVQQMMGVVARGGRVRQWDPLFVAMFDHHNEIDAKLTLTDQGVEVQMTGTSRCGQALVQAHTKAVSGFVQRGRAEAGLSHKVPEICQKPAEKEQSPDVAK